MLLGRDAVLSARRDARSEARIGSPRVHVHSHASRSFYSSTDTAGENNQVKRKTAVGPKQHTAFRTVVVALITCTSSKVLCRSAFLCFQYTPRTLFARINIETTSARQMLKLSGLEIPGKFEDRPDRTINKAHCSTYTCIGSHTDAPSIHTWYTVPGISVHHATRWIYCSDRLRADCVSRWQWT